MMFQERPNHGADFRAAESSGEGAAWTEERHGGLDRVVEMFHLRYRRGWSCFYMLQFIQLDV